MKPQEHFFDHAHFEYRDWLFAHKKSCVNEKVKMKEMRQNCREIRVQDDKITENANAISPLTFRNLLQVVA